MAKPKIAIDIDEVLSPFHELFLQYHNDLYGTNYRTEDHVTYDMMDLTGDTPEGMAQKYIDFSTTAALLDAQPLAGAVVAIAKLKTKYDLAIVTGRPPRHRRITADWLAKNFPDAFSSVSHDDNSESQVFRPKYEVCQEIGASILIDDNLSQVAQCAEHDIRGILFGDYPWNQTDKLPTGVKRLNNWDEVLEELL